MISPGTNKQMEPVNPLDHTGLIHTALKSLRYLYEKGPMDYEDCFQIGFIALLDAVETYSSDKGVFSTYIIPRIKWAVQREHRSNYDIIRKPEYLHERYSKVKRAYVELSHDNTAPTTKQIAKRVGIPPDDLDVLTGHFQSVESLQTPLTGQDGITLEDTLEDERDNFNEIDLKIYREAVRRDLDNLMSDKLSHMEHEAIKGFYGWDDGEELTQEQVGAMLGVSIREANGFITKGLKKLRHHGYYLTRKHPEISAHLVYMDNSDEPSFYRKEISRSLFKHHAQIGDEIQVNEVKMVIKERRHDKFICSIGESQRTIFHSSILDVEVRASKVTKVYIK